jgi:hypothetical protein
MRHKLRYNIATGDSAAAREKNNDGVFWMMLEDFMTVRVYNGWTRRNCPRRQNGRPCDVRPAL